MKTSLVHIRSASKGAVYIGPGYDPRNGARLSSARWGNPFVYEKIPAHKVARRYFDKLLGDPAYVERARAELSGRQLTCTCGQAGCHGLVLVGLANGRSLEEIEKDWRDSGLLAIQTELFG